MILIKLHIDRYDWDLTVIFRANRYLGKVADELWNMKCPSHIAKDALKTISEINTGFCYTHNRLKMTLMSIAETDSMEELVNTTVHELLHFTSHVCSYYGISEKSEEAAYLIGDTTGLLYKKSKKL